MRIVLVATALALLAPAVAQAGTYDVLSCRAPGAGGVNHAWNAGYGALDPNPTPEHFDVIAECPGARTFLLARSKAQPGIGAFWAHSAYFRFDAPASTTISRLRLWRHGQTVKEVSSRSGTSSPRPTTATSHSSSVSTLRARASATRARRSPWTDAA